MRPVRWALTCLIAGTALIASACVPPSSGPANLAPVAAAAADPTSGQAPLEVTFSAAGSIDPDGTVVSYSWDFGDGSPVSTDADTTHTYAAVGTFTATLTITDNKGKTDTATVEISTTPLPNVPPVAAIGATPVSGREPLTVAFDGSGSTDTDGTIAGYSWDFGDGSALDSTVSPSHTYVAAGIFVATLTVTDDDGATHTVTETITVSANQAPTAAASATPTSGKTPLTVAFDASASTDADGSITTSTWDFGDGSPTVEGTSPAHVYTTAGTFTATLTVTDDNGATDTDTVAVVAADNQAPVAVANATPTAGQAPLTVSFSSAGTVDTDGTVVSTQWDFGDSSFSNVADPTHTYGAVGSYTATLTVTDDNGATDSATVVIDVSPVPNVAPTAVAAATSPTTGKQPLNVTFSSAGSTDSDGTIVGYAWDFGDGGTSTQANPSRSYTTPGVYTATLTVTDNSGGTATVTVTDITVIANVAPTAAASATPLTGKEPLTVSFDSDGSSDSDGTITSRSWDFGDGGSASSAAPSHTYLSAGTFTATLTVTDDNGATDTSSVTIVVTPNQAPTAVANATPQSGARPLVVSFDSASSIDPDGSISARSWDFGDGSPTSSAAAPTHTYAVGTYNATLTVTDDNGATDTATITITVVVDDDGDTVSPPLDCNDSDPAVYPGAADALDASADDTNCDGYDGVVTDTFFVRSADGLDSASCGPVTTPCLTIGQAQARATASGRTVVQVAGGTYPAFTLGSGLTVRGGYGQSFTSRSAGDTTTVNASFDAGVSGTVGVRATNISTSTVLADITVQATTAPSAGQSSYGLVVRDSTSALTLSGVTVLGATAAGGANGTAGTGGWGAAAATGGNGANGYEPGGNNCTQGGAGGAGVGGGGAGGMGGIIDKTCSFLGNRDAQPGSAGANGNGGAPGGGGGSAQTTALFCSSDAGTGGTGGTGAGGSAGSNGSPTAAAAGTINGSGVWAPTSGAGGSGGLGSNGFGGGGGGGGGAADCDNDDAGAGGGGGGAGGARATVAGTGGQVGGASIGMLLDNASPTLTGVQVTLGKGGSGGTGGPGAAGQPGGAGGQGGARIDRGGIGGNGGNGGPGGSSGGGAGGAGGPAIGVVTHGTSSLAGTISFSGGTGGNGGSGAATGPVGVVTNTVAL